MTPAPTSSRSGLLTAYVAATGLLVALIAVQAVLAGQSLFNSADIAVHGYVGNASFTVGLVAAVLAAVSRVPRAQLAIAGVVLALLFAQTGLGYVGRDSLAAASWHVPLGVTVFGLACVQLALALPLARRRSAPLAAGPA